MRNTKISVIGLGYVGFPLLIELSKKFQTIGYDIDKKRINEIKNKFDRTNEISITKSILSKFKITSELEKIRSSNVYIVTVPTPIFENNKPNLNPLKKALKDINKVLKKNDLIIVESTVYPGATEELIEKIINKKFRLNKDFHIGFCPERVNPGDKTHKIKNISKVISGSSKYAEKKAYEIYSNIIDSKIFLAKNIKTAETAKIIENTQRDLNVALVNELSLICDKLEINTHDVLDAASTKWNFLKFEPGLVGGHCIGVDPYYLTYKAKKIGIKPNVILAGRNVNDSLAKKIVKNILDKFIKKYGDHKNKKVLILGYTFKENCPDIRNSKVKDLFIELKKNKLNVKIFDPIINLNEVSNLNKKFFLKNIKYQKFDLIIFAVKHDFLIKNKNKIIRKNTNKNSFIVDLKNIFNNQNVDYSL